MQIIPNHLTFEPSGVTKTIKIFSTVRLTSHHDLCPIKLIFYETQRSSIALNTCTACLSNVHYGEGNAFELNVTRTSFGRQEKTLIHIDIIPSDSLAGDWKSSKDEVTVSSILISKDVLDIF